MIARATSTCFLLLALLLPAASPASERHRVGGGHEVVAPSPAPSFEIGRPVDRWRRVTVGTAYAGLYGGAAKIGSRLGLEDHFVARRLETAWIIDVFGHVYATRQTARVFERMHRWAGFDARSARVHGAWSAAFGALTYMEILNGFMPDVRFDWLDPISNAVGAWTVTEGPGVVDRHPWLGRVSLELGYDDWGLLAEPDDQTGPFTRIWHDYPNQRWGVGYGIGPHDREWFRVFGTYGVTALAIEEMQQEWGLGVELKPHHWLAPWIRRLPGGGALLDLVGVADRNLLLPGLYVHLATWETEPFSDREPFQE